MTDFKLDTRVTFMYNYVTNVWYIAGFGWTSEGYSTVEAPLGRFDLLPHNSMKENCRPLYLLSRHIR